MIPFLLVLNEVANERHLRAWMRKRPLKHTRLHRDCAICASLCLEMLGGLYVSHDTGSSAEMLCLSGDTRARLRAATISVSAATTS